MELFKKKEAKQYEAVKGKTLTCPVCSNDHFYERASLLNKASSSIFGFDWADRSATCLVCSECTYIYWFLGK
jgi:hypothetical protein